MCKDLQTKPETFGKHSVEASTPLPAQRQLCFTVGQFPMFSFSVQTRDFLSSMATTLHLLKETVPIISRAEWKFLKCHCLLAPGFNLLMFSTPMVPIHSSTLLKSVASGGKSPVLHCPCRGSFSSTGDTKISEEVTNHQHLPARAVCAPSKGQGFCFFQQSKAPSLKTVPVMKTALDFDGSGLPVTGLEVILPLFPGLEALTGPVLVQQSQNTAEPN